MHTARTTTALIAALLAAASLTTGCSKSEPTSTGKADTSNTTGSVTTAAWVLPETPEGEILSITDAKASASEGDTVTIRGRIGGRSKPITPDSPVFLVMDLAIPSCADMGDDDHCATPWDYCCEAQDTITANSATIQIVAPDGSTIETDPMAAGLNPLDEVIVVGTVGPRPNQDVLTIRATGIHRVGG